MLLSLAAANAGLLLPPPQVVQAPVSVVQRFPAAVNTGVFPTTGMLARNAASGAVDLASFLDDVESTNGATDAKAAEMRARLAKEAAEQESKAAIAFQRMEAVKAAKQAELERLEASGLPPCPTGGTWGDGTTGFGQAKACARVRNGEVQSSERTGFFLVF